MTDSRLQDLEHSVSGMRVTTDPADLEFYGRDWTRRWTPAPSAIAFPSSIEQVQEIARWASRHRIGLVPSGGAVAANGELVVRFERMNRVLDFDAVDRTLTVQSGIALEAVQNAAREK